MNAKKIAPKKAVTVAAKKTSARAASASKPTSKKPAAKKTVTKVKIATTKKMVARKAVQKTKTISALKKNVEAKKVSHRKHSAIKRTAYMSLSIILGLLVGSFVHLFVELVYMKKMMVENAVLETHYFLGLPSYLPLYSEPMFLLAGLAFGIWLGFWGWRFVYIERRHRTTRI